MRLHRTSATPGTTTFQKVRHTAPVSDFASWHYEFNRLFSVHFLCSILFYVFDCSVLCMLLYVLYLLYVASTRSVLCTLWSGVRFRAVYPLQRPWTNLGKPALYVLAAFCILRIGPFCTYLLQTLCALFTGCIFCALFNTLALSAAFSCRCAMSLTFAILSCTLLFLRVNVSRP